MELPGLIDLEAKTKAAYEAVDPTALLLADHDWLRFVINEYRGLIRQPRYSDNVLTGIQEIQPRLELHIICEEEAYFPAIEAFMQESGQGSTFDLYGEHDAIRIRIDQLIKALQERVGMVDAYSAFSRSVLIHFENEEELIFEEAPQHLSHDACRDILSKFAALATKGT